MGCVKFIWISLSCIFFTFMFAIASGSYFGDFSFTSPVSFSSILGALVGLAFGYVFARYLFKSPLSLLWHID